MYILIDRILTKTLETPFEEKSRSVVTGTQGTIQELTSSLSLALQKRERFYRVQKVDDSVSEVTYPFETFLDLHKEKHSYLTRYRISKPTIIRFTNSEEDAYWVRELIVGELIDTSWEFQEHQVEKR